MKRKFLLEKRKNDKLRILRARKEHGPDYSENILLELNCEYLSMLYFRSKKDIYDFLDIFNLEKWDTIGDSLLTPGGNNPMKTVFMEICFVSRMKSTVVQRFYKHLLKR